MIILIGLFILFLVIDLLGFLKMRRVFLKYSTIIQDMLKRLIELEKGKVNEN